MKLKIIKEEPEIGKTDIDPKTGIKTTLSDINPETGRLTWDVDYDVDPKFLYNKFDELVNYMRKAEEGTELAQIRDIVKTLRNKTSRLMNK